MSLRKLRGVLGKPLGELFQGGRLTVFFAIAKFLQHHFQPPIVVRFQIGKASQIPLHRAGRAVFPAKKLVEQQHVRMLPAVDALVLPKKGFQVRRRGGSFANRRVQSNQHARKGPFGR
jgi:hypothetical protein